MSADDASKSEELKCYLDYNINQSLLELEELKCQLALNTDK